MINNKNGPVINVGLESDIQAFIGKIRKQIVSVKNIGLDKAFQGDFENIEAMLDKLSQSISNLAGTKLNTSQYIKAQQEVLDRVSALEERSTKLEKVMASLVSTMSKADGGKFSEELTDIIHNMETLQSVTRNTISAIDQVNNSGSSGVIKKAVDPKVSLQLQEVVEQLIRAKAIFDDIKNQKYEFDVIEIDDFNKGVRQLLNTVKVIENIEDEMDNFNEQDKISLQDLLDIGDAQETLAEYETQFVSILSSMIEKYKSQLNNLRDESGRNIEEMASDVEQSIANSTRKLNGYLKFAQKLKDKYASNEVDNANNEAKEKAKDSLFVPIGISSTPTRLLKKVLDLIDAVQPELDRHPLEIDIVLATEWGTRKNKALLKQFQEQIENLNDGSLKEEFQDIINDIQQSFGSQLELKFTSNFSKETNAIRTGIKLLREELSDKIDLSVTPVIGEKETKKLQANLKRISKALIIYLDHFELSEKALSKEYEKIRKKSKGDSTKEDAKSISIIFQELSDKVDNINNVSLRFMSSQLQEIADSFDAISQSADKLVQPINEVLVATNELIRILQSAFHILSTEDLDNMFSKMQKTITSIKSPLRGKELDKIKEVLSLYKQYQNLGGQNRIEDLGGSDNVQKWFKRHINDESVNNNSDSYARIADNSINDYINQFNIRSSDVSNAVSKFVQLGVDAAEKQSSSFRLIAENAVDEYISAITSRSSDIQSAFDGLSTPTTKNSKKGNYINIYRGIKNGITDPFSNNGLNQTFFVQRRSTGEAYAGNDGSVIKARADISKFFKYTGYGQLYDDLTYLGDGVCKESLELINIFNNLISAFHKLGETTDEDAVHVEKLNGYITEISSVYGETKDFTDFTNAIADNSLPDFFRSIIPIVDENLQKILQIIIDNLEKYQAMIKDLDADQYHEYGAAISTDRYGEILQYSGKYTGMRLSDIYDDPNYEKKNGTVTDYLVFNNHWNDVIRNLELIRGHVDVQMDIAKAIQESNEKLTEGIIIQNEYAESITKTAQAVATFLQAINVEGKGIQAITELIQLLAGKHGAKKVDATVNALTRIKELLMEHVDNDTLIACLNELADKGENLGNLAKGIKARKEALDSSNTIKENIEDTTKKAKENIDKAAQGFVKEKQSFIDKSSELLNDALNNPLGKNIKFNDEFRAKIQGALNDLKELDSLMQKHKNSDTPWSSDEIDRANELHKSIEEIVKSLKSNYELIAKSSSVDKLLSKINADLNDNSAMSRQLRDEYIRLRDEIMAARDSADGINRVNYSQFESRLQNLHRQMLQFGQTGKSTFQKIAEAAKTQTVQFIAKYFSIQDWIRYTRQIFTTIKDLDTQLVDLRKTTTMSTSELNEFYFSANKVAKKLGSSTSQIIAQAAAWSRLGYSTKEAAENMAALSSQFAAISPGMSLDDATDGLVSTMKGFNIEVEDVERTIMDNVNRIGNTFATSNGEIMEMLKRSSAAMNEANNTLEETIALESAAVQVTRNAETTGTAFRTISMRIRGYDEETEELSEDLKTIAGDIADLTKTASKPMGISLFRDDAKTEYKSTYELLRDISAIYDELTDKQQAALLEKLAGKRGGQVLAGILSPEKFKEVERALKEMNDAAGSADDEMSIIEDSIEYKINRLKETWVGAAQELIDRGIIGDIVDALTSISEAITSITKNSAALKGSIGAIVGAFTSLKGVGREKSYPSTNMPTYKYPLSIDSFRLVAA